MSRPGKFFSIHSRNFTSIAIRSSVLPCCGQSFTIQTWPFLSMILALTSPTFWWSNLVQSTAPLMIVSRASLTHWGQSESVWRGHPSTGFVFCQDFSKGFSVHFGVKEGLGLKRLPGMHDFHRDVVHTRLQDWRDFPYEDADLWRKKFG